MSKFLKRTIDGSSARYIIAISRQKTVSENGFQVLPYHINIFLNIRGKVNNGLFSIGTLGL